VSSDDFESGTRAAAFGGTTTVIDFAQQRRGETLLSALDNRRRSADGKALVDYGFHMILTDLQESHIEEMVWLMRSGIPSFKLFMAYPGTLMVEDTVIFRAMCATRKAGGLVCVHAENGSIIDLITREALAQGKTAPRYHAATRPTAAEAEATGRALALAETAAAPVYIVHVSCAEALNRIREARNRGLPVYAETCPQYLFLSALEYDRPGFEGAKYVLTPPLREEWNQNQLWKGLEENQLQVVSTDHCPFNFKGQKELGRSDFTKIPNGGPGVENRVVLTYSGGVCADRISLARWVEIVSTAPARLFGLYPRKGTVAVGSDADVVLFDPEGKTTVSARTHHMRVDYSLYEGWKLTGSIRKVYLRGKLIVDGEEFLARPGYGKFLPRNPFTGL
jgi:dihydropyrimidinase